MENSTKTAWREKMMQQSQRALEDSIKSWGLVHHKKMESRTIEKWLEIFSTTEPRVLTRALDVVTKTAERMPTPGMLTKAIAGIREELGAAVIQHGERQCTCRECHGTGYKIVIDTFEYAIGERYVKASRCDCHPEHAAVRGEIPAVDQERDMCWIDARTGDYLYSASNCPEGRAFLKTLAQVAGKLDLAAWYENQAGPRPQRSENA